MTLDIDSFVQSYDGTPLSVTAGRVAVLDLGASALRVLSRPEGGNVTVNPDGTLALVLADPGQRGATSFTVEVAGGRTVEVDLKVAAGPQAGGWGTGDHYVLETDADGETVVEPGENHRKVYVTASDKALSLSDIAAREGLAAKDVDGEWLAANPEYGGSEGMALDQQAGDLLWDAITGRNAEPGSHWLLFERGHEYDAPGRITTRRAEGESPLHPLMVGAWGEGDRPVLDDDIRAYQGITKNFVIKDVDITGGLTILEGENFLVDDVVFTENALNIQKVEDFTLRRSQIVDVIREESKSPGYWSGADNKTSGIFAVGGEGMLIEEVLSDHNAWADDYREDGSLAGGQPPSKFSHNFYVQSNVNDLTFRDNVSMQGASHAAQLRTGGLVEGNAFIDSNAALLIGSGTKAKLGNYSFVRDTVTTLGAHKEVDGPQQGALTEGVMVQGVWASFVDNIVAHLNDPEDQQGLKDKDTTIGPLNFKETPFVDDTIVYNWVTENWRGHRLKDFDQNLPDGIPTSKLDQVTISEFIEDVLGGNVTGTGVDELSAWLRANWTEGASAADIVAFFQEGFGIDQPAARGKAATLTFVPNPLADGVRWDNRANWSTDDLPGTANGDSVDLAGNWVNYAGTTSLKALDLGPGGILTVRQGHLEVANLAAGEGGGGLAIGRAGQLWTDGYGGGERLEIDVDGGRFANTGTFAGPVDLDVSGGETLLATAGGTFRLAGTLEITGGTARIGFDGTGGNAAFALADGAVLGFAAGAGGLATIEEFRSGHYGLAQPGVKSSIDLGDGDAALSLDLSGLGKGTHTLARADAIEGGFGAVEIAGGKAALRLDYGADLLQLISGEANALVLAGSSAGEVFHAASGVRTVIEGYGSGDVVDVSALAGGTGGLRLVGVKGGQAAIVGKEGGKDVEFARFAESPDDVTVRAAGKTASLKLDTSGGGIDPLPIPSPGQGPAPEPEPEPGPKPGPKPGPNPSPSPGTGNAAPELDGALGTVSLVQKDRKRVELKELFSDPDGDDLGFVLDGAPGFVDVNGQGRLLINPWLGDAGTYTFEVTATDGSATSAALPVTIEVLGKAGAAPQPGPTPGPTPSPGTGNAAPELDGSLGTIALVERGRERMELAEVFSDPDGDELAFALEDAPDFVGINGQGRLIVNPWLGDAGSYEFEVTATDGSTSSAPLEVTVDVVETMDAIA